MYLHLRQVWVFITRENISFASLARLIIAVVVVVIVITTTAATTTTTSTECKTLKGE